MGSRLPGQGAVTASCGVKSVIVFSCPEEDSFLSGASGDRTAALALPLSKHRARRIGLQRSGFLPVDAESGPLTLIVSAWRDGSQSRQRDQRWRLRCGVKSMWFFRLPGCKTLGFGFPGGWEVELVVRGLGLMSKEKSQKQPVFQSKLNGL